eukprot:Plantae.Rhodophyta-Hildenbrandia_rubra.ctg9346.p2 GENE.Plantae.Rhodophyta-Hildenbrandia_rubra.ctg9346~~Plantae.Rhodophyta-Hildenbrandia_rubra.ctg9346.p2  ORF type:complete len:105 (-),score=4.80 Plantae.Rhodophyta-Hildenbrandia_rubra.ctg9346:352-666(-)
MKSVTTTNANQSQDTVQGTLNANRMKFAYVTDASKRAILSMSVPKIRTANILNVVLITRARPSHTHRKTAFNTVVEHSLLDFLRRIENPGDHCMNKQSCFLVLE